LESEKLGYTGMESFNVRGEGKGGEEQLGYKGMQSFNVREAEKGVGCKVGGLS